VVGDVDAPAQSYAIVLQYVFDKVLQAGEPGWAADDATVQAEQMDKQSVMSLMNQPITLDLGIKLMPLGKTTEKSDVITGKYSVSG
jgi:hypothetical protein